MEQRSLPSSQRTVSVLALEVGPGDPAAGPAGPTGVELLRRARREGVTLFDTARSRDPARAQRALVEAFPTEDPRLAVLVALGTAGLPSTGRAVATGERAPVPVREEELHRSLNETRARLRPHGRLIAEVDGTVGAAPETRGALERCVRDGLLEAWSVRVPAGHEPSPEGPRESPELYSVEASLLDPSPLRWIERVAQERPVGAFVRDPFARGLLDGRRLGAGLADRAPSSGPVGIRSLVEQYEPVLRLSFLTVGRRRTLAQAAVRFLEGCPGVLSVVAPFPSAERAEELLRSLDTPALAPEERARLSKTRDRTDAPATPGESVK